MSGLELHLFRKDNSHLLQKLISIKLRSLCFCIVSFIALNNCRVLLGNDNVENIISVAVDNANGDFKNICDHFMDEYSTDEMIAMFDDGPEDCFDLMSHIQNRLDKKYLKNNVINIIVKNKESEELYAQKNLLAKAKNYYFMLKVIVIFVVVIIICYLLYGYYEKLYGYYKKMVCIIQSYKRFKNILSFKGGA